jgi:hypothetical protein
MQDRPQPLCSRRIEGYMNGVWPGRSGLQGIQAGIVEGVDGVQGGIGITAQVGSDLRGPLAAGTGQQDLAAAHHEGVTGAQSCRQGGALLICQWSNVDWCSCHA